MTTKPGTDTGLDITADFRKTPGGLGVSDADFSFQLAVGYTLPPAEAGELLGLSRPFIVRLINAGDLPAEHLPDSTHRVLRLSDVLAFQERRDRRRVGEYMPERRDNLAEDLRVLAYRHRERRFNREDALLALA